LKRTISLSKIESLAINGLILEESNLQERMRKRRDEAMKEVFQAKGVPEVPKRWGIVPDEATGYPTALAWDDEKPEPTATPPAEPVPEASEGNGNGVKAPELEPATA